MEQRIYSDGKDLPVTPKLGSSMRGKHPPSPIECPPKLKEFSVFHQNMTCCREIIVISKDEDKHKQVLVLHKEDIYICDPKTKLLRIVVHVGRIKQIYRQEVKGVPTDLFIIGEQSEDLPSVLIEQPPTTHNLNNDIDEIVLSINNMRDYLGFEKVSITVVPSGLGRKGLLAKGNFKKDPEQVYKKKASDLSRFSLSAANTTPLAVISDIDLMRLTTADLAKNVAHQLRSVFEDTETAVYFAAEVNKMGHGWIMETTRIIVVTQEALYSIKPSKSKELKDCIKRVIPLPLISEIRTNDTAIGIIVPSQYDLFLSVIEPRVFHELIKVVKNLANARVTPVQSKKRMVKHLRLVKKYSRDEWKTIEVDRPLRLPNSAKVIVNQQVSSPSRQASLKEDDTTPAVTPGGIGRRVSTGKWLQQQQQASQPQAQPQPQTHPQPQQQQQQQQVQSNIGNSSDNIRQYLKRQGSNAPLTASIAARTEEGSESSEDDVSTSGSSSTPAISGTPDSYQSSDGSVESDRVHSKVNTKTTSGKSAVAEDSASDKQPKEAYTPQAKCGVSHLRLPPAEDGSSAPSPPAGAFTTPSVMSPPGTNFSVSSPLNYLDALNKRNPPTPDEVRQVVTTFYRKQNNLFSHRLGQVDRLLKQHTGREPRLLLDLQIKYPEYDFYQTLRSISSSSPPAPNYTPVKSVQRPASFGLSSVAAAAEECVRHSADGNSEAGDHQKVVATSSTPPKDQQMNELFTQIEQLGNKFSGLLEKLDEKEKKTEDDSGQQPSHQPDREKSPTEASNKIVTHEMPSIVLTAIEGGQGSKLKDVVIPTPTQQTSSSSSSSATTAVSSEKEKDERSKLEALQFENSRLQAQIQKLNDENKEWALKSQIAGEEQQGKEINKSDGESEGSEEVRAKPKHRRPATLGSEVLPPAVQPAPKYAAVIASSPMSQVTNSAASPAVNIPLTSSSSTAGNDNRSEVGISGQSNVPVLQSNNQNDELRSAPAVERVTSVGLRFMASPAGPSGLGNITPRHAVAQSDTTVPPLGSTPKMQSLPSPDGVLPFQLTGTTLPNLDIRSKLFPREDPVVDHQKPAYNPSRVEALRDNLLQLLNSSKQQSENNKSPVGGTQAAVGVTSPVTPVGVLQSIPPLRKDSTQTVPGVDSDDETKNHISDRNSVADIGRELFLGEEPEHGTPTGTKSYSQRKRYFLLSHDPYSVTLFSRLLIRNNIDDELIQTIPIDGVKSCLATIQSLLSESYGDIQPGDKLFLYINNSSSDDLNLFVRSLVSVLQLVPSGVVISLFIDGFNEEQISLLSRNLLTRSREDIIPDRRSPNRPMHTTTSSISTIKSNITILSADSSNCDFTRAFVTAINSRVQGEALSVVLRDVCLSVNSRVLFLSSTPTPTGGLPAVDFLKSALFNIDDESLVSKHVRVAVPIPPPIEVEQSYHVAAAVFDEGLFNQQQQANGIQSSIPRKTMRWGSLTGTDPLSPRRGKLCWES